jgi:hypothetical protein
MRVNYKLNYRYMGTRLNSKFSSKSIGGLRHRVSQQAGGVRTKECARSEGSASDNVPCASLITAPSLPTLVPLLYHKSGRSVPFRAKAVCLPLYSVIRRQNGEPRYTSAAELANGFGIAPQVPVILTGTAKDRPLERWWSLGEQRREVIRALRSLEIALVTTPNFSLFIDQPRWDDLHSQKRILIVHEEFLREGLPTALHVNARTDRDWERWRDYIAARPEVTHIAFEFATGAGWASRTAWHSEHLGLQLPDNTF